MPKQKKSQIFSYDVIIAVIIFVSAFFIFYFLLNPKSDTIEDLRGCAELVSDAINITNKGTLNQTKFLELIDADYPLLKSKIRAGCDFCIHFEDQDGNLVYLKPGVSGVGSATINISDIPCT